MLPKFSKTKKLVVKDTKKYGKGVFTLAAIEKGQVVHVLRGRKYDIKDLVYLFIARKTHIDNPLQIGKRTHLKLDSFSESFNHSCDPNCGIRKNSELFALRDIDIGEELTYDYSLTVAPTIWAMRCKCGSKICRKVIGDVLSIPKRRIIEYQKAGSIQYYMKKILQLIRDKNYKIPPYEHRAMKIIELNSLL